MPRVTNRIIAGSAVCRDEQLLDVVVAFIDAVIRNCMMLRMCPRALHPVVGRLLTVPN